MSAEADDLDRAQELTTLLNDAYVGNARALAKPEQVPDAAGVYPQPDCECGEAIPAGRLALGKIRCINCQRDLEKDRRCHR